MTYTIRELNAAIQSEDNDWEGSWHEFRDALDSSHEYVTVPAGTEGADSYDGGRTYEKRVKKTEPGATIPGIGRAVFVDELQGREEDVWFVFRVTDADGEARLFRRSGYYSSYGDLDYDGKTIEVSASQQLITVFNPL